MNCRDFPLANTSGLRAGQMKQVSVGETRILLARVGDHFHAVSATCPHYGAPLVDGVLSGVGAAGNGRHTQRGSSEQVS